MAKRDSDYAFSATFWMAVTTLVGLVIVARINGKRIREETLSLIRNNGQPPEDPMDYDRGRSTSEGRRNKDELRREIFGRTGEEFRQYVLARQAADPFWESDYDEEQHNSAFGQWNMRMAEDYPLIERRGGVDRRDVVQPELQALDLRFVTAFRAALSGEDAIVSITQWAEVHSYMMEAMNTPAILYERPDILTEVINRLGQLTTATYMKYRMAILAYVRWLFRTFFVVNAGQASTNPSMPHAAMRTRTRYHIGGIGPMYAVKTSVSRNRHGFRDRGHTWTTLASEEPPIVTITLRTDELPEPMQLGVNLSDVDVTNPDNVHVFTEFMQVYESETGPSRRPKGA